MVKVTDLHGRRIRSENHCQNITQDYGTLRRPVPHRFPVRTHAIDDSKDSSSLIRVLEHRRSTNWDHSNHVSFVIHISVGGLLDQSDSTMIQTNANFTTKNAAKENMFTDHKGPPTDSLMNIHI